MGGGSLELRLGAIFEIFLVSAFGAYFPQYLLRFGNPNSDEQFSQSLLFRSLKVFSGGLVVAVAFCHLLGDSIADLNDDNLVSGTPGYPCNLYLN